MEKNNKKICKICGYKTNTNGLPVHLRNSHPKIILQDYYNKYINTKEHICICGKFLKFKGLSKGYVKTCGDKICQNILHKKRMQNPKIKEKRKQTCLKKYGVENPAQSQKIKDTYKKVCLKKYGVKHHLQLNNVKEKRKNTSLKKYGTDNVFKSKQIITKIKKSKLKKYGNENYNNKEKRKQTNLKKYGNEFRQFTKEDRKKGDKIKKDKAFIRYLNSDRFKEKVIPLFTIDEYKGIYEKNLFKCTKCNNDFYDNMISGKIPRCLICYPTEDTGTSIGEKEVSYFMNQYVTIESNKRFYENGKYKFEIDCFLPEYNIGIEYNGIRYHSEIFGNKNKKYHLNKTNYFEQLGIQIIHIWETEWFNNNNLIKSMLLSKIGKNKEVIYARKCIIKPISNEKSSIFLENNHIQGNCKASIKLGLYNNDDLLSIITLGKSRFNKQYDFELLRFCNKQNVSVIGGFSKLLKYFKNKYSGSILTYADRRFSQGNLYQNNGFNLLKTSPPNYYYLNKNMKELLNRINFQKHKLSNILTNFDSNLSEWVNMQLNGYDRIWDCGNLVYVLK